LRNVIKRASRSPTANVASASGGASGQAAPSSVKARTGGAWPNPRSHTFKSSAAESDRIKIQSKNSHCWIAKYFQRKGAKGAEKDAKMQDVDRLCVFLCAFALK